MACVSSASVALPQCLLPQTWPLSRGSGSPCSRVLCAYVFALFPSDKGGIIAFFLFAFGVLGIKSRSSCVPGKFSTTEINCQQPCFVEELNVETGSCSVGQVVFGFYFLSLSTLKINNKHANSQSAPTLLFLREGLSVTQASFRLWAQQTPTIS